MDSNRHSGPRVAFFGGSFDPPHLGHQAVARAAQAALNLDTVLFAPVGAQPLKPQGLSASFQHRLAMTRLAIASEPAFALSLADAPKPSGEPNYTLETLASLRAEMASTGELFCLMGADAFAGFKSWHRAAEIPFAAPLIVASRPGWRLDGLQAALPEGLSLDDRPEQVEIVSGVELRRFRLHSPAGHRAPFYLLPGIEVEISASQIRDLIRRPLEAPVAASDGQLQLLSEPVSNYIRSHSLYL